MNSTEKQRLRRQKLKASGLCVQCGNSPPRENKTTCETCAKKLSNNQCKWQKKTKKERLQKGLCLCGQPTEDGKKSCSKCAERTRKRYYKRKKLGLCTYCNNETNEDATRCEECARKLKEKNKQLRLEVYEAYGGPVCNCCGETIMEFLTIDHVNNDGSSHRKKVGRTSVLRWLKENEFPKGYQVLCFNCNIGKHQNGGVCPHHKSC